MNSYATGAMIRRLREEKGLTQAELAEKLYISDKTVSKWETGKGYPDITLIEPLAAALGVSVPELLSGENISNRNRAGNMQRTLFHVCPVCGNIITSVGECVVSCCGITLPAQEAEAPDEAHAVTVDPVEDELYVTLSHEMTKSHYVSFIAALTFDGLKLVKLYPEGSAEARFKSGGIRALYWYCNHHGLFTQRVERKRPRA
ncbi:MAG: XRE family transcriptional regulator [Clostridiales bacterium]|nr:XRE family transcriptional regulator [Clostridiales bacterium]